MDHHFSKLSQNEHLFFKCLFFTAEFIHNVFRCQNNALRYNGHKILKLLKIMLETLFFFLFFFFVLGQNFDVDSKFHTFKALALILTVKNKKNVL